MSTPSVDDFFHSRGDTQSVYWDTYLAARPKYASSPAFYETVLAYYRKHGNRSFDLAHDDGCGPGNVAAEFLPEHFRRVVASDANVAHVNVARKRLDAEGISNVETLRARSEDLAGNGDHPATADLIAFAEALPLVDADKTVKAFHDILKPGGTLAVWFYGRPHILSEEGHSLDDAVNTAYLKMADHVIAPVTDVQDPNTRKIWTRILYWPDDIAFPAPQWSTVQRWKYNTDCELVFESPEVVFGKDMPLRQSFDGKHETVSCEVDRGLWVEECGAKEAESFLRVQLPGLWEHDVFEGQEYKNLFVDLEQEMSGSNGRKRVCWPVVLILATKRQT